MIENRKGKAFRIETGVKQGNTLLAVLFNLTLHSTMSSLQMGRNITYKLIQICASADDIITISRNILSLREVFVALQEEPSKVGLIINKEKTNILKCQHLKSMT